jgi:uncharacterized protein
VSQDLAKLIAIQDIDLSLQALRARIAAIPVEQERITEKFDEFSMEYNAVNEKLSDRKVARQQLEDELAEAQRRHEKYKEDLMRVRNEKEYTTCLREIDSTKKLATQMEGDLLQLMEEIEKLEQELQQFAPELEQNQQRCTAQLAALATESDAANTEIAQIIAQRDALITTIPKNLIEQYQRVAKVRGGIALAEARDSSCLACRMKIRAQVYSEIRRGNNIIFCENCSRILYYRAPAEISASAE